MTHSSPEVLFKTCAMKFVDDDEDDDGRLVVIIIECVSTTIPSCRQMIHIL